MTNLRKANFERRYENGTWYHITNSGNDYAIIQAGYEYCVFFSIGRNKDGSFKENISGSLRQRLKKAIDRKIEKI